MKANAAISKGNYEGFLNYCTDDTRWTFVGEQTLNGKDEVRNYMKKTYLQPPEVTVENLIADGDFLVAHGKITLKDSAGHGIEYLYCDVWRLSGGQLAELKAFVVAS